MRYMVGYAENCLLFYSDYIIIQLGMKKKHISTESNIYNMIRIHEFNYHGLKGKENNQHNEILKTQRNDPSWKMTTP